jgi:PKD repeat protein
MRWSVVACVLLMALAGCAEKPQSDDGDGTVSATTSTTPSPSNVTKANQAPTGSLAVAPTGLNATFQLQGQDADGDSLTWNLTFGDGSSANGTFQPAAVVDEAVQPIGTTTATNVTHLYTAAGLFNATFTVSDGRDSTVYNATVNVTSLEARGPMTFIGHVVFPDPVLSTEGECLFALSDQFGIPPGGGYAGDYFTFDAVGKGWTFSFDVDGMIAYFGGNKGPSGDVPADAADVQACSETAVDTDYTLTLTPP